MYVSVVQRVYQLSENTWKHYCYGRVKEVQKLRCCWLDLDHRVEDDEKRGTKWQLRVVHYEVFVSVFLEKTGSLELDMLKALIQ